MQPLTLVRKPEFSKQEEICVKNYIKSKFVIQKGVNLSNQHKQVLFLCQYSIQETKLKQKVIDRQQKSLLQMIQNQMNGQNGQVATLQQINQMFGSLENMYLSVEQLGYYLPDLKCSCITTFFLIKVVNGEMFTVKRQNIAPGGAKIIKVKTKIEHYEILYSLVQLQHKKDLGFDLNRLLNNQYILDLIYVLKPDHPIFKIEEKTELRYHQIQFPIKQNRAKLYFKLFILHFKITFKDLQTIFLPASGQNLFGRTKEQIVGNKKKQMAHRILKKETSLKMLLEESLKVEERLKSLKNDQESNNMKEN